MWTKKSVAGTKSSVSIRNGAGFHIVKCNMFLGKFLQSIQDILIFVTAKQEYFRI